ncbi:hypothetical protein [Microbacterium sp. SA39]|uniref:hypothetical protein n=1 Tax=Microbacterium sp. SA39 TaxID=1263625 RepID=UPI0005FA7CDC|nr:hypothetical protein [Microbacterium sp. SA39]KJQ54304.1 hypothetical protein RS85_01906 [Microbacterium sp. SA39]
MKDLDVKDGPDGAKGVPRRTVIKTAAWSIPVVAVAVSTPLAAASVGAAALTFAVAPLVDIDAPYGAQALTVTNTGTEAFTGAIVFSTPAWATIAPFTSAVMVQGTDGSNITWTLPAGFLPAGQSLQIDLEWTTGAWPLTAEVQPLSASIDSTLGTITPVGGPTVASPYQLLWFGVTPGGAGNVNGTPSLFIANTTETPFNGAVTTRYTPTWTFPLVSATPIVINGTSYGTRVAENGVFVARYNNMPVSVAARGGEQALPFTWVLPGGPAIAQQQRNLGVTTTGTGETLPLLGSPTIYSAYRV